MTLAMRRTHLDDLLAAIVLEPRGVRVQWLETLVPAEPAAVAGLVRDLEAGGRIEFRGGSLVATERGIAADSERGWSDDERRDLHRRLAEGIASSSYAIGAARSMLADHLAASGDVTGATAVLIALGARALRGCEPAVALAAFDRAAELAPLDAESSAMHARSARLASDARCEALWRVARERADARGDALAAARATIELVLLGADGPETLANIDDSVPGWSAYARSLQAYFDADWYRAIDEARTALSVARTTDDVDLELMSLRIVSNAHGSLGHHEVSARVMWDVVRAADIAADPFGLVRAYQGLVETLLDALRTEEAFAALDSLDAFVLTRGIDSQRPVASATRAIVLLTAGRFTESARAAMRAIEQTESGDDAQPDPYVQLVAAECLVGAGASAEIVEPVMRRVRAAITQFGYSSYVDRLDAIDAWHALQHGDASRLATLAGRLDPEAEPMDATFVALLANRAAVIDGSDSGSAAVSRQRLRPAPDRASPYVALAWREIDALAARDAAALDVVTDRWLAGGRRWEAASAQLASAVLHLEAGDEDGAERRAMSALRTFVLGGASHAAASARDLVARIGRVPADADGLLGCDAFAHLDPRLLVQLAHDARRIEVKRGERVVDPEDPAAGGIVIVGDGLAFVQSGPDESAPIVSMRLRGDASVDGWYSAEIAHGDPGASELVAGTDLVAWVIPRSTIRTACTREPLFVEALLSIADTDARRLRTVAAELATVGAKERLARLLLRLVDSHGRPTLRGEAMVDAALTSTHLARMCGSQRQHVSTAMAAWKRDGILDTWKRRIVVVDSARLREAAGMH